MAATVEFRDDDTGYLNWLADHPSGYVLNIQRGYSASDARLHLAACVEINGTKYPGKALSESYVKRCSDYVEDLAAWAHQTVRREIRPCGTCRPTLPFGVSTATADVPPPAAHDGSIARSDTQLADRSAVQGPTAEQRYVAAWADGYIRFERLPQWQKDLRSGIRSRCTDLVPDVDELLHATYFGPKHPRADVENLVLYNIGTFNESGRNGIRFEHGTRVPPAPDGRLYSFGYRYSVASRESGFRDWQTGRELASFGWVQVGEPKRTPTLAQIWLALSRNPGRTFGPSREPEAPFALHLEARPPRGRRPVWGGLVKSFFDGVICAYQAHTDEATALAVADRIALALGEDPREITELLLDQHHAVIGTLPHLVKPFGAGVQWQPSDEMCVAGELLAAPPDQTGYDDVRWVIRGRLVELRPAEPDPQQ